MVDACWRGPLSWVRDPWVLVVCEIGKIGKCISLVFVSIIFSETTCSIYITQYFLSDLMLIYSVVFSSGFFF
jgi:hypothetical protein